MNLFTILMIAVACLLGVGLYGLLITRNLIKIVVVLQLLVKAVVLAFVLAGKVSGHPGIGESVAATVIVADTVVAVIGLALAIQIKRRVGSLDVKDLATLKK